MPELPGSHNPRPSFKRHKSRKEKWGTGRGGSKWRTRRERIFRRDKFQCQICKANGIETFVDLSGPFHGVCDHIKPLSQGGADTDANLQTICQACDRLKTANESNAV